MRKDLAAALFSGLLLRFFLKDALTPVTIQVTLLLLFIGVTAYKHFFLDGIDLTALQQQTNTASAIHDSNGFAKLGLKNIHQESKIEKTSMMEMHPIFSKKHSKYQSPLGSSQTQNREALALNKLRSRKERKLAKKKKKNEGLSVANGKENSKQRQEANLSRNSNGYTRKREPPPSCKRGQLKVNEGDVLCETKSEDEVLELLKKHQLEQYTQALQELGASKIEHLQDLEESDLDSIGMKILEKRRLLRIIYRPI